MEYRTIRSNDSVRYPLDGLSSQRDACKVVSPRCDIVLSIWETERKCDSSRWTAENFHEKRNLGIP